jgi:nucleoside-diphosphate-sugar epimerase
VKIVIVGAGYVGRALAERLIRTGHEVWAARRSAVRPEDALAGARHLALDVTQNVGLEQLPTNADAIVFAVSPGSGSDEAYRSTYPVGVSNVLSRAPSARVLLVSSTSVYGQDAGEWVDEASPTEPPTSTGRRILEAEQLLLAGKKHVVVRASGIYGPGRTSLVDRVRSGEARLPASAVYTNRIHRDDLARVLQFLIERPQENGCFVATDTEPVELGQLLVWLAARLSVPSPPVSAEADAEPRTRHRFSRRCLPHRLQALGFTWRYPTFREGYGVLLGDAPPVSDDDA